MCETNKIGFTPDFEKTEFDNWTVFIDQGGSAEEWMQLLKEKKWKFKPDAAQLAMAYERKFRPLMNRYFFSSNYLEEFWASMCDANNFSGETAERFVKECLTNIEIFKAIYDLEKKNNKKHTMTSVEGYTKLIMFYERQEQFEKAAELCKEAAEFGLCK